MNVTIRTVLIALLLLAIKEPAVAQFTPSSKNPFYSGHNPLGIISADFNGDQIPDLAVINQVDNTVVILLGDGRGNFTAPATGPSSNGSFATGINPSAIATADLNNDGKPDLAITNINDSKLTILLGDGAGGFAPPPNLTSPAMATGLTAIAIADFNQDTKPDLAVANLDQGTVTILLGDGTGNFTLGPSFNVGSHPIAMVAADLNADGIPDLAVANEDAGTVTVLSDPYQSPKQTPLILTSAAIPMVPMVTQTISSITAANFTGHTTVGSGGTTYLDLAVTYYNDTGFQGNVLLFVANEQGGYALPSAQYFTNSVGSQPIASAIGYFDVSGLPGLAIANYSGNSVAVFSEKVAAMDMLSPVVGSPFPTGSQPRAIAVADFNGDGLSDLAVANYNDGTVTVLLNTFATAPSMVSSASGATSVSAESMVSIYGTGLTAPNTTPVVTVTDASGVSYPMTMILYLSPTQINAVMPPIVAAGSGSFVVANGAGAPQKGTVSIAAAAPGLFSANSSGKGPASGFVENLVASGTQNPLATCTSASVCIPSPFSVSSGTATLLLYGTGIGNLVPLGNVTVMVNAVSLAPFFAGPVPNGMPGLDQVNIALPASLAHSGTVFVQVAIGSATSNQVTIAIQ